MWNGSTDNKEIEKISPLNFYERHPKIEYLDIILFNYCVALIHVCKNVSKWTRAELILSQQLMKYMCTWDIISIYSSWYSVKYHICLRQIAISTQEKLQCCVSSYD